MTGRLQVVLSKTQPLQDAAEQIVGLGADKVIRPSVCHLCQSVERECRVVIGALTRHIGGPQHPGF